MGIETRVEETSGAETIGLTVGFFSVDGCVYVGVNPSIFRGSQLLKDTLYQILVEPLRGTRKVADQQYGDAFTISDLDGGRGIIPVGVDKFVYRLTQDNEDVAVTVKVKGPSDEEIAHAVVSATVPLTAPIRIDC